MSAPPRALTTYGSIRFRGDTLDITKVTPVLGVPAKVAYTKGEVWKKTSTGREVRGRTNLWLCDSRIVESPYLNDHVSYLSNILWGRRSSLGTEFVSRLRGILVPGVQFDVSLFWHGPMGSRLPVVDPSFHALVEGYGGVIETDFDTDDGDDDE